MTESRIADAGIWNAEGWLDGSVIRRARKSWRCAGNGAGRHNIAFAPGHRPNIFPGDQYLEYLGERHGFEHGTCHCMPCAEEFYRRPTATEEVARDRLTRSLEADTATCTCGRPLTGDLIFVCSGCKRNAAECRCRGIMHVTKTLPASRPGGLFANYQVELIHDPRANTRTE